MLNYTRVSECSYTGWSCIIQISQLCIRNQQARAVLGNDLSASGKPGERGGSELVPPYIMEYGGGGDPSDYLVPGPAKTVSGPVHHHGYLSFVIVSV